MRKSSNILNKSFIIVRIAFFKGGICMQNKAILSEILTKSQKRLDFVIQIGYNSIALGVWLSLVERLVRDQEAGSSNLLTPTIKRRAFRCSSLFFALKIGRKRSDTTVFLSSGNPVKNGATTCLTITRRKQAVFRSIFLLTTAFSLSIA